MAISLRCRRYLLFTYIIIFVLCGVAISLCGSYLLLEIYSVSHGLVLTSSAWGTMVALLATGIFALLAAWFGWRATCQRKAGKIDAFTWMLILTTISLFAVCGVSLAMRHSVAEKSARLIELSFSKAIEGDSKHDRYWEAVQNEQKCCGLDGPSDYRRSRGGISWSCCTTTLLTNSIARDGGISPSGAIHRGGSCASVHQRGCLDAVIDKVRELLVYTSLVGLVAALMTSVGIFCSIQLSSALKSLNKVTRVSYKSSMRSRSPPLTHRQQSDIDSIAKV